MPPLGAMAVPECQINISTSLSSLQLRGFKCTNLIIAIDMAPLTHIPLQRPDHFNFATDVVDTWAAKSPSLEAMLWVSHDKATQKSLTYQHFSQQSQRIALLLEQLGARPGDVMLMVLPRAPAW